MTEARVRDLYPYLRQRAQMGREGVPVGIAVSVGLHLLVLGLILFTPHRTPSADTVKVTWVSLPAAGVQGVAGGQGPMEEGESGERQRRVEEVAPRRNEPTGHTATPNAWGTRQTKPIQGTSSNPDSMGKAPVASKGRNASRNPAPGAAGSGGGGGIGAGTGIPGLKAAFGVSGGSGLVDSVDGDNPGTWYLMQVQNKITGNWARLTNTTGRTLVYFRIQRNGRIEGARVETTSGNSILDQSALMAVNKSNPLPPIPDVVEGSWLGIHFWFTYQGN